MTARRYCVIGAGAAGLAAIKELRDQGYEVVCFEKSSHVGGHWHTDYQALYLITPRDSSGYPERPMPDDYPLFPHRDHMRDYLIDYARHHQLISHIAFNAEVLAAEPLDDSGGAGWTVRTTRGDEGRFDGVLVANGHLWDPFVPAIPGSFTGRALHSARYSDVGDIAGERVLVVGSGNSGCDLAVDTAQAGLDTSICVRSGQTFQPKTLFGRPRSELPMLRKLPPTLQDWASRALINVALGRPELYPGLPAPRERSLNRNRPVVNSQLLYWIQHGRVRVVPGIERLDGKRVHFTDGASREFDTILWATGFRVSLPFLRPELAPSGTEAPLRTAGATLPTGADRLYFVGLCAPRGPQLPVYAAQAALICRFIRMHEKAPDGRLALAAAAARELPIDEHIDIVRATWQRQMKLAHKFADRLERSMTRHIPARSRLPTPVPAER
ncbi:MAG: NAD(P)-binding protein [Pseudonocardiaceae bacterium]|nr:NAD(P)-binding protein [Pseudonocardiaceae bacterium]